MLPLPLPDAMLAPARCQDKNNAATYDDAFAAALRHAIKALAAFSATAADDGCRHYAADISPLILPRDVDAPPRSIRALKMIAADAAA